MTFCALLFIAGLRLTSSRLIGAAVLPHGDFAYDPSLVDYANGSEALHAASLRAGSFVTSELRPDVILLTTPHGLELDKDFLIYENSRAAGAALVGADLGPNATTYQVPLAVRGDSGLAVALRTRLKEQGFAVGGLQGFSDSQPLPVNWGEILPLSYVNASAGARGLPPVIVVSVPFRRFNHSAEMVREMLQLGGAIATELDASDRRVAWVVSADLAHTHLASGPYGYCPCAQLFDDAVGRYLRTLSSEALVSDATEQQRLGADSCGFTGLVLLEGALRATGNPSVWRSQLLALAAPTYYGMAVATLTRGVEGDALPSRFVLV